MKLTSTQNFSVMQYSVLAVSEEELEFKTHQFRIRYMYNSRFFFQPQYIRFILPCILMMVTKGIETQLS